MANGHVRPGQSVTWRNETGAPVRSGALVSFGGGIAAKALQDIPAGQEGVVTLFQVHRFPLPDGLSFSPGDMVYVDGGEIAASGDVLGRFLRLDEGGWAEVLIMPLSAGGGGGGTSDIAWKPAVSAEGVITWTRSSSTTAPPAQNIKGPQGEKGEKGDPGPEGPKGEKGEKGDPGTGEAFVATYGTTTAQEIIAHLEGDSPLPMFVERNGSYYTVTTAAKQAANKIIIRTFATLGGEFYMFTYTITDGAWSSASSGFQQLLASGQNIKTINGQSLLGSGNMVISGGGTPVVDGTTIKIHNDALMGTAVTAGGSQDKSVTVTGINGTAVEVDLNNDPTVNVVSPMLFNETVELQKKLVSGTNIKTVGGQSLLGSGDIPISGGGGNSFLITKGTTTYAQLVANKSKEMWFVDPAETTFAPRPVIACVVREASQQVLITVQKTTSSNEVWQVGSDNAWSVVQTNQFLKLPQYQLSNNDSGGNVIQKGEIVISGATYGLFEFYFQTGLLPAANATEVYSFANLFASYTIHSFVDATGMTEDGIFIGNGRTDNDNRLIVQQFSKNSKNVTIRAYKDFSTKTALLKVQFIGTKN